MIMKKTLLFLILIPCLVAAQSQTEIANPPPSGISQIDRIVNSFTSMNATVYDMTVKVDNIPGLINESYYTMGGRIIFGDVLGMLIIYLAIVFFDKRRKLMKKKTHEEYIRELEDKLNKREDKIIQRFNETTDKIKELTEKIDSVTLKPVEVKTVECGISRGELAFKQASLVFILSSLATIGLRVDDDFIKTILTVIFIISLSLSAKILYMWRKHGGK